MAFPAIRSDDAERLTTQAERLTAQAERLTGEAGRPTPLEAIDPSRSGEGGRCSQQGTLARIDSFVAATRAAVFVRRADRLLLIRPEKTLAANDTALAILEALYADARHDAGGRGGTRGRGAGVVLAELAPRLGASFERLLADTDTLLAAVRAILNQDFSPRPGLRHGLFDRKLLRYPILAEIALTYGCQNRCTFCYAASPQRAAEHRQMTTAEVQVVMDKIFHQAHVPSLSFTGGEATLRPDLPQLIRHSRALGFRTNLISNGIRLADDRYAAALVEAGLDSAQISLEAATPELHDAIVGRRGSFAATVAGIRNLGRRGIHVHTNTTLCGRNLEAAADLIRFVARELERQTLSMNLVIRTGAALSDCDDRDRGGGSALRYAEVAARLPALSDTARGEGIRFVWYSPIPYCLFNPVLHGLGAKACACVDGIVSVDPAGNLLPCSSFASGLGSLLQQSFEHIYRSRPAAYWRGKQFVPPPCRGCADVDVCAGACPLYWDAAGGFAELPRPGAGDLRAHRRWQRQRRRGGSFGVPAPPAAAAAACHQESARWDA